MKQKPHKRRAPKSPVPLVTIGVLVPPTLKELIKEIADAEMNTMSRVTLRMLKESPTLQRALNEAEPTRPQAA